jgi:hypothetical protein
MTRIDTTIATLLTTSIPCDEVRGYIPPDHPYPGMFFGVIRPSLLHATLPRAYLFSRADVPEYVKRRFEESLGVERVMEPGLRTMAYAFRSVPTRERMLLGLRDFMQSFGIEERVTVEY